MKTNKSKYFDKVWGISKTAFKKKATSAPKIKKNAAVIAAEATQNNGLTG